MGWLGVGYTGSGQGQVAGSLNTIMQSASSHCPSLYRGGLYSGQRRPETEEASPQQNYIHDGSADCSGEGVREDTLP
jgi:hypothetical protein